MKARIFSLLMVWGLCAGVARSQEPAAVDEIPIEKCDVLPVVKLTIDGVPMTFLLDTGATTILNLGSFSSGRSKQIEVSSWNGTAATSAKEVKLPELVLGSHRLKDLRLPAIDLGPIGKACGARIDGILGVDVLDRMGVTIDLKRKVARMESEVDPRAMYELMESGMHQCTVAFEKGDPKVLEECFDPEIVLYTRDGEFRGNKRAVEYLQERFMKYAPNICYKMNLKEAKMFGEALWYSYDYTIETPAQHITGHGMSMCKREHGKWVVLNLHNAELSTEDVAGKVKSNL